MTQEEFGRAQYTAPWKLVDHVWHRPCDNHYPGEHIIFLSIRKMRGRVVFRPSNGAAEHRAEFGNARV